MVRTPSLSISSGEMDREKATQTLSSAFASMMAVGAPYQTSRNPFAASASQLKIDDGSDSRQGRSSSSLRNNDERSQRKSRRFSAFSRSGRSISPFRFGSKKRSSSANRLKIDPDDDAGAENGNRSEREKDSDTESVMSSASGIIPRNSAFYNHDDDDDDDLDASLPHSHRRHHPASLHGSESQLPQSGSSTSLASTTQPLEDAHGAEADVESDDEEDSSDLDAKHSSTNGDEADKDDEDDPDDIDPIVLDNTIYNAEYLTSHEHWHGAKSEDGQPHFETYEDEDLERDDEHITAPNVVLSEDQVSTFLQRRGSKMLTLTTSRPRYERNRCTIGISHGDADAAAKRSKRPKRYVVASDGSEESSYAVEWTIGTVLRDGDEMLVVSVMETDTKLDALDPTHEEASARMEHQRIRQAMASVLAKQATHLLERTRLEVKISCQAIHAKNSRHMLLDLIDFYEPTMVVVGSRGLGSLKGILLGSTSHYLVQKSSAPVMVARKRLKLPALPRGKGDVVESVRARHMRLDQASIEKVSNVGEDAASVDKDAQGEDAGGDDSSPDNENGSADKADSAAKGAAATTGEKIPASTAATTSAPPRDTSPAPSKPVSSDGSPKLQRKGSKAGPTAIPHTSLEGEAETRIQIQQRKEEAARLHEGDKKRHAFGHHSHHLKTSKSPNSDDDTDPTDDDAKHSKPAQMIDAAAKKE